jgi:hypothetical protein
MPAHRRFVDAAAFQAVDPLESGSAGKIARLTPEISGR